MARDPEPVVDAYQRRCLEIAAERLATPAPAVEVPALPAEGGSLVLLTRSAHGQVVTYAPMRIDPRDGRAPGLRFVEDSDGALQLRAIARARELRGAGVLLVMDDGTEWLKAGIPAAAVATLDACVTSVYENHVRALLDLPLGSPALLAGSAAVEFVGWAPALHGALRHCMARDPGVRIHLYGTEGRPGMTIGHVCVVADEVDDAVRRARHAADYLTGTIEE